MAANDDGAAPAKRARKTKPKTRTELAQEVAVLEQALAARTSELSDATAAHARLAQELKAARRTLRSERSHTAMLLRAVLDPEAGERIAGEFREIAGRMHEMESGVRELTLTVGRLAERGSVPQSAPPEASHSDAAASAGTETEELPTAGDGDVIVLAERVATLHGAATHQIQRLTTPSLHSVPFDMDEHEQQRYDDALRLLRNVLHGLKELDETLAVIARCARPREELASNYTDTGIGHILRADAKEARWALDVMRDALGHTTFDANFSSPCRDVVEEIESIAVALEGLVDCGELADDAPDDEPHDSHGVAEDTGDDVVAWPRDADDKGDTDERLHVRLREAYREADRMAAPEVPFDEEAMLEEALSGVHTHTRTSATAPVASSGAVAASDAAPALSLRERIILDLERFAERRTTPKRSMDMLRDLIAHLRREEDHELDVPAVVSRLQTIASRVSGETGVAIAQIVAALLMFVIKRVTVPPSSEWMALRERIADDLCTLCAHERLPESTRGEIVRYANELRVITDAQFNAEVEAETLERIAATALMSPEVRSILMETGKLMRYSAKHGYWKRSADTVDQGAVAEDEAMHALGAAFEEGLTPDALDVIEHETGIVTR